MSAVERLVRKLKKFLGNVSFSSRRVTTIKRAKMQWRVAATYSARVQKVRDA